jgi:histidine triad (HIT) family protein
VNRFCVFCAIVAGTSPSFGVEEDEHTYAFMDALPMTPGHVLVIPKRHVTDVFELDDHLGGPLFATARRVAVRQRDVLGARGVNVLNNNGRAADQSQFHLHLHVIPRYGGDRLLHPWERTFGDLADMAAVADRLRTPSAG